MSIAERHRRIVEPPEEHGDGISVVFHSNGDNMTTVTARDAVRECEKTLRLPTRIAELRSEEVRKHMLHLLTQELNGRPMQVGAFSESKTNGSDTMPQ
ncbi:MAG: hypothetical protein Q7S29_04065 [Candidatus Peribacter sp.]|nr:hypothetical protein [Candidatus Peribacter sp.]